MITDAQLNQAVQELFRDKIASGWAWKIFPYQDEKGTLVFARVWFDPPPGCQEGKYIRPISHNGEKWVIVEPEFPEGKPLYNLFDLLLSSAETVWIVEGEKCADALKAKGLLATTSGAATSASQADWSPLAGRSVIIWRDNDEPGFGYARQVTEILHALGCTIKWVEVGGENA